MENPSILDCIQLLLQKDQDAARKQAATQLVLLASQHEPISDFEPHIADWAKGLNDQHSEIQYLVAHGFIVLAERKGNIAHALGELLQCLESPTELKVQKEAVWAIVCMAYNGTDITAAMPLLDNNIGNATEIRGNGTIALALQYWRSGYNTEPTELLHNKDGQLRFGVAYAATILAVTAQKNEPLQEVLAAIHSGLSDRDLIMGTSEALNWLRGLGHDIQPALSLIHQASQQADMVRQAALNGIFMHLTK